jgi:hypothetical protein
MSDSPLDFLARTTGGLLASGARAVGAGWHRVKPLHPEGSLRRATITRTGGPVRCGVPWIDGTGQDEALVRVSRAIGLPEWLPDIHGLALRVAPDGTPADLLLASTGLGRLSRFVLTAARRPTRRPLTSLLPYRSPRGPLLVAAVPDSERTAELHGFDLCWAGPIGPWHRFGRLELGDPRGDDLSVSFDPVLNQLPGLSQYGWVSRLREPAYGTARERSGRAWRP